MVQPALVQPAFILPAGACGCDLSAAYDPNHPCTSAGRVAAAAAPSPPPAQTPVQQAAAIQQAPAGGCDPNAAYDPDRPCRAADAGAGVRSPAVETSYAGYRPAAPSSAAPGGAGPHLLAIPDRDWGIQVGAYANAGLARAVAEGARAEAPDQLRAAAVALPPTPNGGAVLYRARLVNLSASAASNACTNLNRRQLPCVVVQPNPS